MSYPSVLGRHLCRITFLTALTLGLSGCGEPAGEPCSVRGSVSLNGTPIEQGTIVFEPQGQGGARGGAAISSGEYEVVLDRGMWAGPFLVRISGFRETGKTEAAFETLEGETPESVAEVEEIVPNEFNSDSTLQVSLEAGENVEDFQLTGERAAPEPDEYEY